MRTKASAAMPTFWDDLGATEQDELANMYAYFDYKLATFLIMAGEHSYLRFQDEMVVDRAGTDLFQIVPPFPEFDRLLGEPQSDGIKINSTTWEREFEYCMVTLDVDGGTADIDWTHRADSSVENMAEGKPATQISTAYGGDASRVVDGNTDGVWQNDSVNHTATAYEAWWEVDLEAIREIGDIDVWNRTDCCGYRTADFYVLVSVDPFESDDLATTLAQPGVQAVFVEGEAGTPTSIQFDTSGRYVRVQLTTTAEKMNMAEVQVWSR